MNIEEQIERLEWARHDIIEQIHLIEGCRGNLCLGYEIPVSLTNTLNETRNGLEGVLSTLAQALIDTEKYLDITRKQRRKGVPLKTYLPKEE